MIIPSLKQWNELITQESFKQYIKAFSPCYKSAKHVKEDILFENESSNLPFYDEISLHEFLDSISKNLSEWKRKGIVCAAQSKNVIHLQTVIPRIFYAFSKCSLVQLFDLSRSYPNIIFDVFSYKVEINSYKEQVDKKHVKVFVGVPITEFEGDYSYSLMWTILAGVGHFQSLLYTYETPQSRKLASIIKDKNSKELLSFILNDPSALERSASHLMQLSDEDLLWLYKHSGAVLSTASAIKTPHCLKDGVLYDLVLVKEDKTDAYESYSNGLLQKFTENIVCDSFKHFHLQIG